MRIRSATPGTPLWVGGVHDRVLELTAEVASGWNGWMLDADRVQAVSRRLPAEIEVTWGGAIIVGRDADAVDRLIEERGSASGAIVGTPTAVAAELRSRVTAGAEHLVLSVLPNRAEQWEQAVAVRRLLV